MTDASERQKSDATASAPAAKKPAPTDASSKDGVKEPVKKAPTKKKPTTARKPAAKKPAAPATKATAAKSTVAKAATKTAATKTPAKTAAKTTTARKTATKTPAITKPKPVEVSAEPTDVAQTRPPLAERVVEQVDAVTQSRPPLPSISAEVAAAQRTETSGESAGDDVADTLHSVTTADVAAELGTGGEAMADDAAPYSALANIDHEPDDAAGGTPRPPQRTSVAAAEEEQPDAASEPEAEPEPEPAEPQIPSTSRPAIAADALQSATTPALVARGLVKTFGGMRAVDQLDLTVPAGTFYGIVGPNGAGKTTTLSMLAGLLRPDAGTVSVAGIDVKARPRDAKKLMGVLPDRFRTFDRLTGRQLLHYYGALRGLASSVIASRAEDLARAFDLTEALTRPVADYSAGMTKKVMLAGALIHSPRVLVLDEPFESVDPVSAAVILDILTAFVKGGGTVILSSHGMDLVEKVCSRVAVIVAGQVLAEGTVEEVRDGLTLEQRFVELSGGLGEVEGLEWLHTSSD